MKIFIAMSTLILLFACKEKAKKVVQTADSYYTCSMHPQVMQETPGKCPICGMELILVKKNSGQDQDAIVLSDQQVQLGNIQVDTLSKSSMGDKTVLTATVNVDETKSATVNVPVAGRIEKLYFKNTGDYLRKGDRLYDLYSEELNNAKQEYLLALEKRKVLGNSMIDFNQLVQSAGNKLLLWGMSKAQVEELSKTKENSFITTFYSPVSGYITRLESHEGDYATEGTTVLSVADLSSLWAEAQVYASRLSALDPKSKAIVKFPDLGEKEVRGRIVFVNPEIKPDSRINLIRIAIPNPGGQLKPGMPAYVILRSNQSRSLTLPAGAVIRNANYNLVWLKIGHNTYKSVIVETGHENGDRVEIKSGLKPGDIVVTSGAYLVNSEYIFKHGANPMGGMKM